MLPPPCNTSHPKKDRQEIKNKSTKICFVPPSFAYLFSPSASVLEHLMSTTILYAKNKRTNEIRHGRKPKIAIILFQNISSFIWLLGTLYRLFHPHFQYGSGNQNGGNLQRHLATDHKVFTIN